jgi:copper(I)-binding protein
MGRGARRRRRPVARAGALVPAAIIAAVLAATTAQAASDGLSVSDPWMRFILPARPAAGYFTLSNQTDTDRTLVGAASPACGMLMMHRSARQNGRDAMVMVDKVPAPAHGAVKFAPGGYHLMCMSPAPTMAPGQTVKVTLRFADGATLSAQFPVRGATAK